MSADRGSNRQAQPGQNLAGPVTLVALCLLVLSSMGAAYVAAHLGNQFAGTGEPVPKGFGDTVQGVLKGTVHWPTASTVVFAGLLGGLLLLVLLVVVTVVRRRRRGGRADWTAGVLGRGREIEGISRKKVAETANRLGVDESTPGMVLGRTVAAPHQVVFADWESTAVLVAGPRFGKSTSYVIPHILDAPGAVLATANKRDVSDATRDVRAAAGSRPWVFDPQRVALESPTWWWNPLSYVTDEVKAANLAEHFAANSRPADAKTDAYFEPEGKDLLRDLLLAAALDGRPITDAYRWTTRPDDRTAIDILERHGYDLNADNLSAANAMADKQRSGVFGTAKQMASCLTIRSVLPWVTDDGSRRPHFDPDEFVRQGETLYSLSREGRGNVGGLVTALTVAVCEAAEEIATASPGGRLAVPLSGVLDEAANVCRWSDLPNLYSHYGSRGIILEVVLQGWSQGVEVWGRNGMNKLWSSSNVKTYAGNVAELDFLKMLSELIGTYDKRTQSVSTRATGGVFNSGTQLSTQLQREHIFEPADLAALPRGRAIVLSAGNRPTLVETVPWMNGPHAAAVNASIRAHEPVRAAAASRAAAGLVQAQAVAREAGETL